MIPRKIASLFLGLAVCVTGCNRIPTTARPVATPPAGTNMVTREMRAYSFEQRAGLVEHMEIQLGALKHDLEKLDSKVGKANDADGAEARPKLLVLREQVAQLHQSIYEVRNATESTWEPVRNAAAKAMDDTRSALLESGQWLGGKLAR